MPSPKKPSPAFPLYAGDVLADTGALSATEMGVLYRLTLNCWRLRVLPADPSRLSRMAQVSEAELMAALPALVDHLTRDGDCYRSAAVEKAVVEQAIFAEKQRGRAQSGWDGVRKASKSKKRMLRHATAQSGMPKDAAVCPSASASALDAATDPIATPRPPSAEVVGDSVTRKKQHPDTEAVIAFHAKAVKHWKPNANVNPLSVRSLEGFDRLLGRAVDVNKVRRVLTYLFRGDDGDYAPRGEFDWRPNLLSGASVEQSWDKIEALFDNALAREVEGTPNGHR